MRRKTIDTARGQLRARTVTTALITIMSWAVGAPAEAASGRNVLSLNRRIQLSAPLPQGCSDTALTPACVERLLAPHLPALREEFGVTSVSISGVKVPRLDRPRHSASPQDRHRAVEISRSRLLEEGVIEPVLRATDSSSATGHEEPIRTGEAQAVCVEYSRAAGATIDTARLVEYLFYASGWRTPALVVRPGKIRPPPRTTCGTAEMRPVEAAPPFHGAMG